jgi:hypothetical protein
MICRAMHATASKVLQGSAHTQGFSRENLAQPATMNQQREQEILHTQSNTAAHSASLESTQTSDSMMWMHGNHGFPVYVLEPSLQEWPNYSGQHTYQQPAFAGRHSFTVGYPAYRHHQNLQHTCVPSPAVTFYHLLSCLS